MLSAKDRFYRRKKRNTVKIMSRNNELYRFSVFRSNCNIYTQIIDDQKRATLVSASSLEKELIADKKGKSGIEIAAIIGKKIAERAKALGIKEVVFDRSGRLFHGRIKNVADSARQNGLKF